MMLDRRDFGLAPPLSSHYCLLGQFHSGRRQHGGRVQDQDGKPHLRGGLRQRASRQRGGRSLPAKGQRGIHAVMMSSPPTHTTSHSDTQTNFCKCSHVTCDTVGYKDEPDRSGSCVCPNVRWHYIPVRTSEYICCCRCVPLTTARLPDTQTTPSPSTSWTSTTMHLSLKAREATTLALVR